MRQLVTDKYYNLVFKMIDSNLIVTKKYDIPNQIFDISDFDDFEFLVIIFECITLKTIRGFNQNNIDKTIILKNYSHVEKIYNSSALSLFVKKINSHCGRIFQRNVFIDVDEHISDKAKCYLRNISI